MGRLAIAIVVLAACDGGGGGKSPDDIHTTPYKVRGIDPGYRFSEEGGYVIASHGGLIGANPDPDANSSIAAAFFDPASPAASCTDVAVAGCRTTRCTGLDLSNYPSVVSGGAMTATIAGGAPIDVGVGSGGGYNAPLAMHDGDALHIATTGDRQPALAFDVVIPAKLAITAPMPANGGVDFVVTRADGLDVAWTGGAGGTIVVSILQPALPGGRDDNYQLQCAFESADGAGAIPAAALAEFIKTSTAFFLITSDAVVDLDLTPPLSTRAHAAGAFYRASFQ